MEQLGPQVCVRRAGDRHGTPWKNGGGVTSEVAVWPEAAGLDDFEWRISIAQVAVAGPFSLFPGVDRILTAVALGADSELVLVVDGVEHVVEEGVPLAFSGDSVTRSRLRGGPVRDLNVMTRRARWRAAVEVVEVATATTWRTTRPESADTLVLVVLRGEVTVAAPDGPAALGALDAVVVDDPAGVPLTIHPVGSTTAARVAAVRLRRR